MAGELARDRRPRPGGICGEAGGGRQLEARAVHLGQRLAGVEQREREVREREEKARILREQREREQSSRRRGLR